MSEFLAIIIMFITIIKVMWVINLMEKEIEVAKAINNLFTRVVKTDDEDILRLIGNQVDRIAERLHGKLKWRMMPLITNIHQAISQKLYVHNTISERV